MLRLGLRGLSLGQRGGGGESLGPELAKAITAANWTATVGAVTVTTGAIQFNSLAVPGGAQSAPAGPITSGATYRLDITVSNYVSGGIKARLLGGGISGSTLIASGGDFTFYFAATGAHTVLEVIRDAATVDLDVTAISLKQVL